MSNRTSLRLRVLPRFPARIIGANGLDADRDGTDMVVKPDFGALVQIPSVSTPETTYFWGWDQSIDMYSRISFQDLVSNIQDVIIGPTTAAMEATTPGANQFIYFTGTDAAAVTGISEAGRDLVGAAGAAAQRDVLELGTASTADATDFATATQGGKADTALQAVDLSSDVSQLKGLKTKNFFSHPTLDLQSSGFFLFQGEGKTTGEDVHALRVDRRADYTGGTNGFENAAILARNTVSATSTQSYEDAGLFILDNFSPGPSQNCAGRFVGRKQSTGSTWSIANEAIDFTGTANPTSALLGIEQVIAANGTDANNNRVGFDAVISRPQVSGAYSGASAQGGAAFRATNQIADAIATNRWKVGYEGVTVGASTGFDVVFDSSKALIAPGGAAFRMANGQKFSLSTGLDRTIRYDAGAIRYNNNSVDHWLVTDGGATDQFGTISIQGTQVVTSRRTGWAADTGTPKRTANATYSATAEPAYTQATIQALMDKVRDLSQTIKAMKDDLLTHGLIGP
ncbi:hypothetical protein J5288_08395 [Agrobacterium sp. S2/73]|uniref:hypothetical protein n=1 Tax=Rhizobium/Agrobacterium group TaxID=227290 RepID=UPI001ADD3D24|nr:MULTISPECIES: hypothetical protein [Rhizobium/Agrobacterium group]MBO9108720.1 hypothetical protein [Agrobacterium sp. S2/73]QXZ73521.1 hypothetical protein J5276_06115 [Agrobacterium sp. S7/73]